MNNVSRPITLLIRQLCCSSVAGVVQSVMFMLGYGQRVVVCIEYDAIMTLVGLENG